MNILLLNKYELTSERTAEISDRRKLDHLYTVLKITTGDTLTAGLLNGRIGTATVTAANRQKISLTLELDTDPPAPLPVVLVTAMSRPKSFRKVLHYAVSLGIKQLHVIKTWRVDKSYWQSPILTEDSLSGEILLALEQCEDTVMPEIHIHTFFKPFIEDIFPKISHNKCSYIAHPYHAKTCPSGITENSVLAIGPEGGFIQYEVDAFISNGCIPVTTGPRILRVETAVPAFIGKMFL